MSVRHKNDYTGRIEILDNPLSDCACNGCSRARRSESGGRRRGGGRRSADWKPGNNGTVSGQPAEVQHGNTGRPERVDAYWPSGEPKYGHLVSNDGVNANFLREPGEDAPVVDDRRDNPYG